MKSLNKNLIILSVILAFITAVLIYAYLHKVGNNNSEVEYENVAIAIKTIEKKAVVASGDVKLIKIPKDYANSKAVTSLGEIIGKRVSEKIIEGEQILHDRILSPADMILSHVIPEGKRAISINVNEASEVADFIRPGDYVDILATFDRYETEDASSRTLYPRSTKIILQNILILGMGQLQEVPDKPRQDLPGTVTLAVTAEEAEKLALSEEMGVLKLALRRTGDSKIIQTPGVVREEISDKGKWVIPK